MRILCTWASKPRRTTRDYLSPSIRAPAVNLRDGAETIRRHPGHHPLAAIHRRSAASSRARHAGRRRKRVERSVPTVGANTVCEPCAAPRGDGRPIRRVTLRVHDVNTPARCTSDGDRVARVRVGRADRRMRWTTKRIPGCVPIGSGRGDGDDIDENPRGFSRVSVARRGPARARRENSVPVFHIPSPHADPPSRPEYPAVLASLDRRSRRSRRLRSETRRDFPGGPGFRAAHAPGAPGISSFPLPGRHASTRLFPLHAC